MYRLNFLLLHVHKWSLVDIENMIPWEREVYVAQLGQFMEEQARNREKINAD